MGLSSQLTPMMLEGYNWRHQWSQIKINGEHICRACKKSFVNGTTQNTVMYSSICPESPSSRELRARAAEDMLLRHQVIWPPK